MPYEKFTKFYTQALSEKEEHIEAICVSSFNNNKSLVDSRYVNLKYIIDDEWIFFSNYNSPKSEQFKTHDQVAVNIFWKSIYVQVRIIAKIRKSSADISDKHFSNRATEKNALAISSNQSEEIESYEKVVENHKIISDQDLENAKRPDYWGGFSFVPLTFEFWEGNSYRLNKRVKYIYDDLTKKWTKKYLQP